MYCAGPEPPVFVVSATKFGVVPDTGLYKRFRIKWALNLAVSTTGERWSLPDGVDKVRTRFSDLLPDISFVSLICEATIWGAVW